VEQETTKHTENTRASLVNFCVHHSNTITLEIRIFPYKPQVPSQQNRGGGGEEDKKKKIKPDNLFDVIDDFIYLFFSSSSILNFSLAFLRSIDPRLELGDLRIGDKEELLLLCLL
jgi:hypothetical protein